MKPVVVLLHGLLRTSRSMSRLGEALERDGHTVIVRGYPSQRLPIARNAEDIAVELANSFGDRPLVFVTHSLGGVIARFIAGPLAERFELKVQGIVMLAPPNSGSRLAQRLGKLKLFQRLYGPAGQELRSAEQASFPSPPVPIAVIAGTTARGMNPVGWLSRAIGLIAADEPSDGTVLVEETRIDGMVDFATVAASHTFIMDHPEVHTMVRHFIREGRLR